LVIPPVCIRPSLKLSSSATLSNEDDLTMNIRCLIRLNRELRDTMSKRGEDILKV
jgi:DNA-directed RNA polymerase beta' subunit